ncbi:hypothetical protein J2128_001516 [Methanomicrobium sp. W14]|uniref:zinc-dependent metalloprotease n=1 Tax=Methanomicrobium sp. W14 TaxID=2817839 RepID=UPI001FD97349|nr:zinc-dependent metalloprotease [Methanomicrobium sp. W14]MBP2133562.1 hypothetical protein [Methanomicrobium sp. W14]
MQIKVCMPDFQKNKTEVKNENRKRHVGFKPAFDCGTHRNGLCSDGQCRRKNTNISSITEKLTIIKIGDGISEAMPETTEKSSLDIPDSIEKYDLFTLDIQKMRDLLISDKKIPVTIDGVSYSMNLSEMEVNAPDVKSQTYSYVGNLEDTKDSEVVLTISERVLIARINVNGIDYVIESTPDKSKSGRIIHYSHRSTDVKDDGSSLNTEEDYLAHKYYSDEELKQRDDEAKIEEERINSKSSTKSLTPVRIRVFTDNQWISDEPDWLAKAQDIIAELNNQFQRSDIFIRFYAHYDTSKASALSSDSQHITSPCDSIIRQVPIEYLNSNHEDIALYLGGYDSSYIGIAATYGYDCPNPLQRRYAWVQMKDDPSSYDGVHEDRAKATIHEIGHIFDADHQQGEQSSGQGESYNRAYQWTENLIFTKQTVMWTPILKSNTFEVSSNDYHGDYYCNNALRIYETKNIVASYAN